MRVIYTKHFPPGGFRCINLFGVLFYKGAEGSITARTRNHEGTHSAQGRELWWVGFYLLYVLEWLVRLVTDTRSAYRSISFEQEAYAHQDDDNYNATRERHAWRHYLWWGKYNDKKR